MELPLQQHPDFGTALQRLGTRVGWHDAGGPVPVQVITRFGLCFAPRGPVWPETLATAARAAGLRASPVRLLNADSPSPALRQAGFRQIMTPAFVGELPTFPALAAQLAQAHGKWRNAARKGLATLAITQTRFDPARHGWLLEADLAQQRAKRYRALPHRLIHAFAQVRPANVQVVTAQLGADTVAAMLFLRHGSVATYHIGWSDAAGRAQSAHHAMLARAATRFAAEGVVRIDLGTVDTENAAGLARFKIGSGAAVRSLGGTWLRLGL